MVCSKNIRTNSIVYFEKNEFNYNVRKNIDINTHVRLRIIWKKKISRQHACGLPSNLPNRKWYDIVNIARRFATIWMINMYCWNKYYWLLYTNQLDISFRKIERLTLAFHVCRLWGHKLNLWDIFDIPNLFNKLCNRDKPVIIKSYFFKAYDWLIAVTWPFYKFSYWPYNTNYEKNYRPHCTKDRFSWYDMNEIVSTYQVYRSYFW